MNAPSICWSWLSGASRIVLCTAVGLVIGVPPGLAARVPELMAASEAPRFSLDATVPAFAVENATLPEVLRFLSVEHHLIVGLELVALEKAPLSQARISGVSGRPLPAPF